ncbi:ABC transporter substrate-binding protein [Actinomadura macra]|uniref:ABC transporter substrate-binding protein n=1 Tax=Actinomadura macra TaxID=46164 RepID=UPI000834AFEB|nr:ABC transporter substrate-binding protein [Actinomadura macra]
MGRRLSKTGKIYLVAACLVTLAGAVIGLAANHLERPDIVNDVVLVITFAGLVAAIIPILLEVFPAPGSQPGFPRGVFLQRLMQSVLFVTVIASALILTCLVVLASRQPVIKIGFSLPFLGRDKQDALAICRMINLALEEEVLDNKIGRFNLQIVAFDDSGESRLVKLVSPDGCEDGGRKKVHLSEIVDDARLAGIIGPFNSGVAVNEMRTTNRARVPLISPANTADCLTDKSAASESCNADDLLQRPGEGSFFRLVTVDSVRQRALAMFLYQQNPNARVVIAKDQQSVFGDNFAAQFIKAWKELAGEEPPFLTLSSNVILDLKTRIRGEVPDFVLYAGTGSEPISLYDAVQTLQKQKGYQAWADTIFVGPAAIMNQGFSGTFQHGTIKAYAIAPMCFNNPNLGHINAAVADRYRNSYPGEEPTSYSAVGYDAARILIKAVRSVLEGESPKRAPVTSWDPFNDKAAFRSAIVDRIRHLNRSADMIYENGLTINRAYTFQSNGNIFDGTSQFAPVTIFELSRDRGKNSWKYVPPGSWDGRC